MATTNITVSVEEETKKQFAIFCENVGMNVTTAFNMFMKAVLRTRQLPFTVTDIDGRTETKPMILTRGREALKEAQNQALANGTSELTLDEINEEIATFRREKRGL